MCLSILWNSSRCRRFGWITLQRRDMSVMVTWLTSKLRVIGHFTVHHPARVTVVNLAKMAMLYLSQAKTLVSGPYVSVCLNLRAILLTALFRGCLEVNQPLLKFVPPRKSLAMSGRSYSLLILSVNWYKSRICFLTTCCYRCDIFL